MCLCNCSKQIKRKKHASLTQTQRRRTHITFCCLCFNGLKSVCIKLQCFKMRVHATDVTLVPLLGTSTWFCPGCWSFCLPFTSRGGRRIKIAVTQMMKRHYCKECILRHHEINYRIYYETIDFLFRPSDIYRHIAQPWCCGLTPV